MPPYASPSQRPAASITSSSGPFRPAQLRTPVPPTRQVSLAPHRPRHGLGRPSSWALAVAALLVGLILGLVWAGTGATVSEIGGVGLHEVGTSLASLLWSPG